jgi:hypothetical protein
VYNLVTRKRRIGVAEQAKDQDEIQQTPDSGKVRRISADGVRWLIKEVPAPSFDRRGGTHLLFDGESIMRRVRVFPNDWHTLSDKELYELSRRITPKDLGT